MGWRNRSGAARQHRPSRCAEARSRARGWAGGRSVTGCAGLRGVRAAGVRRRADQDGRALMGRRNRQGRHDQAPKRLRGAWRASPLCHWPESFITAARAAVTYTVGGSVMLRFSECCADERSVVPESFRGGCSFGGQHAGSLPLIAKLNLVWFVAEVCCSTCRFLSCEMMKPAVLVSIPSAVRPPAPAWQGQGDTSYVACRLVGKSGPLFSSMQ